MAALRALWEWLAFALAASLSALVCLSWGLVSLVLGWVLRPPLSTRIGRAGSSFSFRAITWLLAALRIYRLDLRELDALRSASPMVLTPNHPTLFDAALIISRVPNLVCVMKAALQNNIFLGASARLDGYVANDSPRRMIRDSVRALESGAHVLLFPEGTRSPLIGTLGPLKGAAAVIAKQGGVPVQTLLITTDSPYMSKSWPITRKPKWPIHFSIRLGRRFEAPKDVAEFMVELEKYFESQLDRSAEHPSS